MALDAVRAGVREARKRKGLTQQQVADMAGLSLRAYNGYERGEFKPQAGNMAAILAAVGMDAQVPASEVQWSPDVAVFLDTMGAFLEELSEGERLRFMRDETRRIFAAMRPVDAQGAVSAEEAEEARRAMQAAMPAQKAVDAPPVRRRRTAG